MSSDEELAEVKRVVGSGSQRTALEGTERKQLLAPRGPGGDAQSSEDLGESLQLVETVLGGCPKYLGAVSKDSSVGLLVAVAQRLGELRVGSAADLLSLAERKLSQPNDDDDPGATARCQITLPGTPAGKLQCQTSQSMCYTATYWRHYSEAKGGDMYDDYVANRRYHLCVPKTGGAVACPDGIGPLGVLMTANLSPRHSKNKAVPKQGLPLNVCAPWSYIGTFMLRCHPLSKACTKAQVLHPHGSKRSVGTLILKRTVCDGGACKVFKVGRCVDVGKDVWRSIWNQMIGHHMSQEAKKFAAAAEICLAKEAGKSGGCGACSLEDGARSKEEVMSA